MGKLTLLLEKTTSTPEVANMLNSLIRSTLSQELSPSIIALILRTTETKAHYEGRKEATLQELLDVFKESLSEEKFEKIKKEIGNYKQYKSAIS